MESVVGMVLGTVGGSFTNAMGMVIADGIAKVTGLNRDTGRLYLQTTLGTFAISVISSSSGFAMGYKMGQLSSSVFWATLLGVKSQYVLESPERRKTASKMGGVIAGSLASMVTNVFFGLPFASVAGAMVAYHYNGD
jgi:hypothetical protein